MKKQKSGAYVEPITPVEFPSNAYDDGNIPEIDLPGKDMTPDQVPKRDGYGGETASSPQSAR